MLVTFKTRHYPDITLFGEPAIRLLKLMGHSGTVPGALAADDVQAALDRLRTGVAAHAGEAMPEPGEPPEGSGEPPVSLAQRAFPLLELLERAVEHGEAVRWE